jgi:hypothetical protein
MPTNQYPIRPKSRDLIYDVIDGERDYQDANHPNTPVGEMLDLIREYAAVPLATPKARKRLREIAALAVRAIEATGGAVPREFHVPASAGITGEMHIVTKSDGFK